MRFFVLIFALFFLAGSFLPSGNTFELTKVGSLVEHYSAHTSTNKNLSFWDFIAMHYFDHNHESSENHNNLPFHNSSPTVTPVVIATVQTIVIPMKVLIKEIFTEVLNIFIPSGVSNSIWQPPKF